MCYIENMRLLTFIVVFLCGFTSLAKSTVRVAIIDTGLSNAYVKNVPLCDKGHKDFSGQGLNDTHGHGTNITGIIVENVNTSDYCLIIIKVYNFDTHKNYLVSALEYAATLNVDIINLSGGGQGPVEQERLAVEKILNKNILFVVAAGNDSSNLDSYCNYYPACYDKRIIVVGANKPYSNYGTPVHIIGNGDDVKGFGIIMHGTSQATALHTVKLINILAKARNNR